MWCTTAVKPAVRRCAAAGPDRGPDRVLRRGLPRRARMRWRGEGPPFFDLSLPFLDLSLTFLCLSLTFPWTFLCLSLTYHCHFHKVWERPPAKTRWVLVGDSITYGYGATHSDLAGPELSMTYPTQLQRLLDPSLHEVHNEGLSGRTMLKSGNMPVSSNALA